MNKYTGNTAFWKKNLEGYLAQTSNNGLGGVTGLWLALLTLVYVICPPNFLP